MYDLFHETLGLSEGLAGLLTAVAAAVILVTFVAVSAIFFIWLERKVAGSDMTTVTWWSASGRRVQKSQLF